MSQESKTPLWVARFIEGMRRDTHGLFIDQSTRAIFKSKDGDGLNRIAEEHNQQIAALERQVASLTKERDAARVWMCHACQGSGEGVHSRPCARCRGSGAETCESLGKQVASLTAKLAEARKDWLPIESAPFIEDETGPLILLRGSYIVAGDLSPATTVIGYSNGRKGKFSTNALPFHATHWQPLPTAPTE